MSTNTPDDNESIEPRTERSLTEYMSVLPEGGEISTAVGQSGCTCTVDGREGRCTCPDARHWNNACRHQRPVAFAIGERPVPIGADGEILEGDSDMRSEDCGCWDADAGLPYWQCYREGFDKPNSAAERGR